MQVDLSINEINIIIGLLQVNEEIYTSEPDNEYYQECLGLLQTMFVLRRLSHGK